MHQRPTIRLAFIGTGDWARSHHLPALAYLRDQLHEQVDLTLQGILGLVHAEAEELQQRYGFVRRYQNLDALLADDAVNAVAVVISPSAMREVVLRLLVRRVPILTEKPPGADFAEAQDLARRVTVPNIVAFNRRYKPLNNQFRALLSAEKTIRHVRGSMFRADRREEHFILHTGIHLVNFMEYLFGPITGVRTEVREQAGAADTRHIGHVRFESALEGSIEFAPRSGEKWEGVAAQAGERTLTIRCPLNQDPGLITVDDGGACRTIRPPDEAMVVREGMVAEYLELFDVVSRNIPARSHFGNAANCMRIAAAIETGRDCP